MSKYINIKSDIFNILILFIVWRIILFCVLFYGMEHIPLGNKDRFLGGGPMNFNLAPELLSWANFDGEHYLSIAMFGYKALEQAFFPIYPLSISILTSPFHSSFFFNLINATIAGLLISNISFFFALIVLYKLIILDFSKKISILTIVILLVFPTSFYFGALYSESLFLLLSLLAFYNARKKRWILASVFGFIASATRAFGVLLLIAFLFETYQQKEKFKKWFWILLIPLGLVLYMIYQYSTVGDYLAFYRLQTIIGEQHQSGIVFFPQVLFRYGKMITTTNIQNPIYQTIWLEFITGLLFFLLPIIGFFKKVRFSYLTYAFIGLLLPTIQGSFSSVPRYAIVLFPCFLILASLLNRFNLILRLLILVSSLSFLVIEATLFLRGYWVA